MTDSDVHTGYYFIERLGGRQTEPLYLDFSYHFESLVISSMFLHHAPSIQVHKLRQGHFAQVTAVVDVEIH